MGGNLPRILVVEDEPLVIELVARALRGLCVVQGACDGADGLERLRAEPTGYALVVSDLSMPRMDGLALYDVLRAELPAMAARFVMVTGGAQNARDEARLARADIPVLWKPFNGRDLSALVRRYLDPAQVAATS
jgi:CheY-like chemotaxis protein